ncbi:Mu-like prophage major head subunit gpT family protein [Paracoccaceae bacterium Fryx2]|nr:Mu-like prophage major head subunit gpT family protein [Paracoccaceae bacterium Fryx2]
MIINSQTLDLAFRGFKTVYSDAFAAAPAHADKIAMTVPSASRDETYGWLGMFPRLREWVGGRYVNGLKAHGFTIANRKFEATVSVGRTDIADDKLGLFKPMFAEMGQDSRRHPEELVFGLLKAGFTTNCFDGQNFFDTDHPVELDAGAAPVLVSNMQAGSGAPWFLLDTSRAVRPIIWQEREKYEFQSITGANDQHVFMNDEYIYGVRARVNAGFGLWQLAFGSKADLTEANYAAARAAMMNFKSDGGRILGVPPTVLVVPPSLESAALHPLNTETKDGGGSNPWKGTAELIVTPYVA